jgi:hypothetical protein
MRQFVVGSSTLRNNSLQAGTDEQMVRNTCSSYIQPIARCGQPAFAGLLRVLVEHQFLEQTGEEQRCVSMVLRKNSGADRFTWMVTSAKPLSFRS